MIAIKLNYQQKNGLSILQIFPVGEKWIFIILSIIRTPTSRSQATVSVPFVHGQTQMSLHTNCI